MNLRNIEAFYWVARLGGFRAAAAKLGLSQPAISARINELEAALAVQLIERGERPVQLTAKGEELMPYAQRMVSLAEEMRQRMAGTQDFKGLLRIGATSTLATLWLPKLIRKLAELYPAIEVEITVDLSIAISRLMADGLLDLAFLVGPVPAKTVRNRVLRRIELGWVTSNELGVPPSILSPRALAEWPLITDARGSALHQVTETWLSGAGVGAKRLHFCSGLVTRMELAAQGVGIAILPKVVTSGAASAQKLRLVTVDTPLPSMEFVMATVQPIVNPAIGAVADLAADIIASDADFRVF